MRAGVGIQAAMVGLAGVAIATVPPIFTFYKQPDLAAGISPIAVATADLDSDGKLDLAGANFDSDDISIFWGNGDGSFSVSANLGVGGASIEASVALAIADVNGDGQADILTANQAGNTVSVFLNLGERQFAAAIEIPTGTGPEDLVVADFNGDRVPDIATADLLDDTVTVLLGNNDGTFSPLSVCSNQPAHLCRNNDDCVAGGSCLPKAVQVGTEPTALAAADFNRDGKIDLAVANSAGGLSFAGSLMMLEGVGNGMFIVRPEIDSAGLDNPVDMAAGDLNYDGTLDIAVVNEIGDSLSVFMGNGDLSVQNALSLHVSAGSMPEAVVIDDFNGDRILDIATSASFQDKVFVFAGSGSGAFAAPQDFALAALATPFGLASADFNKDRKIDLACANMQIGTVSLLLNATAGGCAYDCNGDGIVTVDEVLTMVNIALGNGAVSMCFAGDSNADQQIRVDEILAGVAKALNGCGA